MSVMVQGYVLDSACAFTKSLEKPISRACARDCAHGGSPSSFFAGDRPIYWPISDSTPAVGQNPKLMKFAGKRVNATGKVFAKGGSKATVITAISSAGK